MPHTAKCAYPAPQTRSFQWITRLGYDDAEADLITERIRRAVSIVEQEDAIAARNHDAYVTLDQASAVVSRSKWTLRRAYDNGELPDPDVSGGNGRPHEWRWSRLRPELERLYDRQLPNQFPADRFSSG